MNRMPEVEIKIIEAKGGQLRIGLRIHGSTGAWNESGWLIAGDTVRVNWPEDYEWTPPVQILELPTPESELVSA